MVGLGGLIVERQIRVGSGEPLGLSRLVLLLALDVLVVLKVRDVLRVAVAFLSLCLRCIVVELFVVLSKQASGPPHTHTNTPP